MNGDEPLLVGVENNDKIVYYVSEENDTFDCYAKEISESVDGISFTACVFGKQYRVALSVCGRHFVINSLFALATAYLLGIDVETAAEKLGQYESDGKRQFVYEKDGHTIISDCYNASPESMKAALSVLAVSNGRRVAVLGDMLELGSETVSLHRLVGEYTAGRVDVLITFGELARNIASSSCVSEKYSFAPEERGELKEFLSDYIKSGDSVLYKASNGMNLGSIII